MRRTLPLIALALAVAGFGAALWRLFELRFSAGDVYPPASSFRADPLGARAYYESLALLPDRKVSRLLEPIHRLGTGADTTLFLLGCDAGDDDWLNAKTAAELDDFIAQGGRVVVTMKDSSTPGYSFAANTNRPARKRPLPGLTNTFNAPRFTLADHWHFSLSQAAALTDTNGSPVPASVAAAEAAPAHLPRQLAWRSPLRLAGLNPDWRPLYADTNGPVLAARAMGKGWLIVATGSRFHSNEALRGEREPALLAWLPGPNSRLVFDETHLGTELNPGVMTLARRYRLHGLGVGLLILSALFIWQQSTSLVPRRAAPPAGEESLAAQDSATGFVNLLRRALPASELIGHCFTAWRESVGRSRPDLAPRLAAMQDLVNLEAAQPPKARNPIEVYRRLTEILNRR